MIEANRYVLVETLRTHDQNIYNLLECENWTNYEIKIGFVQMETFDSH